MPLIIFDYKVGFRAICDSIIMGVEECPLLPFVI